MCLSTPYLNRFGSRMTGSYWHDYVGHAGAADSARTASNGDSAGTGSNASNDQNRMRLTGRIPSWKLIQCPTWQHRHAKILKDAENFDATWIRCCWAPEEADSEALNRRNKTTFPVAEYHCHFKTQNDANLFKFSVIP